MDAGWLVFRNGTASQAVCTPWTISQRTIRVALPIKTEVYRHEKPNSNGTLGDVIRAARLAAGYTREQFSKISGIPIYWLGRWERDRAVSSKSNWETVKRFLRIEV